VKPSHTTSYSAVDANADEDVSVPTRPPLTVRELLAIPSLRAVCAASAVTGLIASGFNHVVVLIAYTPIENHGLGLSVSIPYA
jgi:hypothetical protein